MEALCSIQVSFACCVTLKSAAKVKLNKKMCSGKGETYIHTDMEKQNARPRTPHYTTTITTTFVNLQLQLLWEKIIP